MTQNLPPQPELQQEYCFCKKGESNEMIACDACDRWYHFTCVKITRKQAKSMSQYICPKCTLSETANGDKDGLRNAALNSLFPTEEADPLVQQQLANSAGVARLSSAQKQPRSVSKEHTILVRVTVPVKIVDMVNLPNQEGNEEFSSEQLKKLCNDWNYMSMLAQQENPTFKALIPCSRGKLLFHCKNNQLIGYFLYTMPPLLHVQQSTRNVFSAGQGMCLHQIYIVKSQRRKGYATLLLNYFLNEMSTTVCQDKIRIESPNMHTCELLSKLGAAKKFVLTVDMPKKKAPLRKHAMEVLKDEIGKKEVVMFFEAINKQKSKVIVYIPKDRLHFEKSR